MPTDAVSTAAKLSDKELLRRVEALAGLERHARVELIAHLAELDRRKLYREQGYGSLFSYCTGALRLSEHAAFNRIEAARASRVFPVMLKLLAEGSVNLSTVRLLAPHLTPANHEAVLADAKGRSKREVEELVARLAPRAEVPGTVRKLPAPASLAREPVKAPAAALATAPAAAPADASAAASDDAPAAAPAEPPLAAASAGNSRMSDPHSEVSRPAAPLVSSALAHRPVVAPLAPGRYRVQFTIGCETREKLRRVQDLLRREVPDGDPGAIFDRALTLLLADVARKKLAATPTPRASGRANPQSRHVPAQVKRTVWLRDGGQCAFVSRSGRRCRERAFLEFHHVHPYGSGGETTVANLSLRCRAHNAYEAELVFGPQESIVREPAAVYGTGNGVRRRPTTQPVGLDSPRGEFACGSPITLPSGLHLSTQDTG